MRKHISHRTSRSKKMTLINTQNRTFNINTANVLHECFMKRYIRKERAQLSFEKKNEKVLIQSNMISSFYLTFRL